MRISKYWTIGLLLLISNFVGCAKPPLDISTVPSATLKPLVPYWTPTATSAPPTPSPRSSRPVTPSPTATPFIHIVISGETMLGIALQYGVTLEALKAVNPEVDPRFLPVGAQLVIPLSDEIQVEIPNPTPVAIKRAEPICYLTGDGGAWCYMLVENDLGVPVENLSAWIGLYGENGELIASSIAVGALNILRPDQAIPLSAFFSPPLTADFLIQGELLTAVEIPVEDTRYLDWLLSDLRVDIQGEVRTEAWITGVLEPPPGSTIPSHIWILAVAYNQAGQVVGTRKYEILEGLTFDMILYSLEGEIERVEILTEIRP